MSCSIVLYSPGNLNLGDNAILFTWLDLFERILEPDDEVVILGCECGFLGQYLNRYHFRVFSTDILHRYIWNSGPDADAWEKAADLIVKQEKPSLFDCYCPAFSFLPKLISRADYVHVLGGGILNGMWLDIYYQLIILVQLSKQYGKAVVFTGQTIGPYSKEQFDSTESFFKLANLLDLRDRSCYTGLLSINSNTQVTVDDTLICQITNLLDGVPKQPNKSVLLPASCHDHINICLQEWSSLSEEEYYNILICISELVDKIIQVHPDYKVNLLEFMPLDHDMQVANKLYDLFSDKVKANTVKLCLSNYFALDAVEVIKTAKLNIGTRFHMAVYSLSNAVPMISIVLDDYYRIKFDGITALYHQGFYNARTGLGYYDITNLDKTIKQNVFHEDTYFVMKKAYNKLLSYHRACWQDSPTLAAYKFKRLLDDIQCMLASINNQLI